jgi:tRNA(fMet)-specific endonuclease VapC
MNSTAERYLLDTNILTDLIKNPGGRVKEHIVRVGEANVCTSMIVACELRFGARKKNAPLLTARVERLLQAIEVLPFDGGVDRAYAEVRAMLEALGRPSGANDMLIAAHAVNEECILVTNNESEFVHVAGLVVENWLAP